MIFKDFGIVEEHQEIIITSNFHVEWVVRKDIIQVKNLKIKVEGLKTVTKELLFTPYDPISYIEGLLGVPLLRKF